MDRGLTEKDVESVFRFPENDSSFPLSDLAVMAREQFLAFLKMSGFSSTDQSCVFGSHYLLMILKRFGPRDGLISIQSGGLKPGTGIKSPDGQLNKHMWVLCEVEKKQWVVDITADQFGFAPVCYVRATDAESAFIADHKETTEALLGRMHQDDAVLREMFKGSTSSVPISTL